MFLDCLKPSSKYSCSSGSWLFPLSGGEIGDPTKKVMKNREKVANSKVWRNLWLTHFLQG